MIISPKGYVPPPGPNEKSKIPEEIIYIYVSVLKHDRILSCEKQWWSFPPSYKISIFGKEVKKFIKVKRIINIDKMPSTFLVAAYTFINGKVIKVE